MSISKWASQPAMRGGGGSPVFPAATYSQGMGATDATGFVTSFPFNAAGSGAAARQYWVDDVNGDDAYNGLSPYPGFRMNGTGTDNQYGATGQGSAAPGVGGYGPKKTFIDAYLQVSNASSTSRVGNQIFLVEGGAFTEGTAGSNLSGRSGASVNYPFCIQSYKRSDPLNYALHGRATGANRPKLGQDIPNIKMKGCTISGDVLTVPSDALAAELTGNVSGSVLTIESISFGKAVSQDNLLYSGQTAQGVVFGFTTGRGGVGTYSLAPATGNTVSGTVMTTRGIIRAGQTITSPSIAAGTKIISQISGTAGRAGTYRISIAQTISTPEDMTATGVGYGAYTSIVYFSQDNPIASPPRGNFAFRGFDFDSGTTDNTEVNWVGNPYNVLFENCKAGTISLSPAGVLNSNNNIIRHCNLGYGYSSAGAFTCGIYASHVDALVMEDNVIYRSGWSPNNPNRQLATFTGVISGTTLTVSGIVADQPIRIGQGVAWSNGSATITALGTGTGGNGTYTVSGPTTGSTAMVSKDNTCPNVFRHNLYLSYGSSDQMICRRNVIVDGSASGISGRGSLLAYHNVLIDNPIQMVAGGSVTGNFSNVGNFTGDTSGTTLTVSGFAASGSYPGLRIGDRIAGTGITGTPTITTLGTGTGGNGTYTLSVSQSTLTGVAMTNQRTGYALENPTGVDFNYHHSLILGSADITAVELRNQGVSTQNGRSGSAVTGNLIANTNLYSGAGVSFIMQSVTSYNQPSYVNYDGNRAFYYDSVIDRPSIAYPSQAFNTYGTNLVDTNFPTPMSNAQFYAAMQAKGYGDGTKAGLMLYVFARPEINWAYIMMNVAATPFGHDFALGG